MALNATRLGSAIKAAMVASYTRGAGGAPSGAQDTEMGLYAADLAAAVVGEITGNAEVSVTVPVDAGDAGLQSYTVPPAGAVPTTGPLVPTSLDGTGSVS